MIPEDQISRMEHPKFSSWPNDHFIVLLVELFEEPKMPSKSIKSIHVLEAFWETRPRSRPRPPHGIQNDTETYILWNMLYTTPLWYAEPTKSKKIQSVAKSVVQHCNRSEYNLASQ